MCEFVIGVKGSLNSVASLLSCHMPSTVGAVILMDGSSVCVCAIYRRPYVLELEPLVLVAALCDFRET